MPPEGKKDSKCYIPVGAKLIVKGWVVKRRRRLFAARAEIRMDGSEANLPAEAEATMCLIGPEGRSSGGSPPLPHRAFPICEGRCLHADDSGLTVAHYAPDKS